MLVYFFITPPVGKKIKWHGVAHPIFPFGCNNSQYKAVINALENSFSIIQGPPGTGKTQTILNIIANLIILNKTVLIVSNNNSAIENVYEKLSSPKYNLGFIVASLGKSEKISEFLENQTGEYPSEMQSWKIYHNENQFFDNLSKSFETLKSLFEYQEQESVLKHELEELETEYKHFSISYSNENFITSRRLIFLPGDELMNLWQNIQFEIDKTDTLGFFFRLKLLLKYRIRIHKDKDIEINTLLEQKIEQAMKDFDYSATPYTLDFTPGRFFYFYHDCKRGWK